MIRGRAIVIPGHALARTGAHSGGTPIPHDAAGVPLKAHHTAPGYARCGCGEVSRKSLASGAARARWHLRHREELASVPWSDKAMSERSR